MFKKYLKNPSPLLINFSIKVYSNISSLCLGPQQGFDIIGR